MILWMFAVVILGLLILANFSFELLWSARAYVGAGSSWSKAQKDAVYNVGGNYCDNVHPCTP
jgi:hypothetical protein